MNTQQKILREDLSRETETDPIIIIYLAKIICKVKIERRNIIMANLSATERLAQEELDRREKQAFSELLKPVREEQQDEQKKSQEWTERVNALMKDRAERKKEQEEAQAAAEAEAEARKPQELHDSYAELLRGMKGED